MRFDLVPTKIRGALKPQYILSPVSLMVRIRNELGWPRKEMVDASLAWGSKITVQSRDVIGRTILNQRIFDLSVSEVLWRLVGPGDSVIDAGANIGYMSALLAHRVGPGGRVHSFEPHPEVLRTLRGNAYRLNALAGVDVVVLHPHALGHQAGTVQLYEPHDLHKGSSSIKHGDGALRTYSVPSETLDRVFAVERFRLLKLDVEGAELDVLHGARGLLSRRGFEHVVYEAHDGARSEVHAVMRDNGYSIYSIGYSMRGLRISPGTSPGRVNTAWESLSYLATLSPDAAVARLSARGWNVLRGRG